MSVKIDLMILGFEKSGTTSLYRHIAQSPTVFTHQQREMFYFLSQEEFKKGWGYAVNKYFSGYQAGLVVAKNVMQINSREAMTRLKTKFPDVKCIVMLREPAARAYSAYNYAVLRGVEKCRSFEEALGLEDERFKKDPSAANPLLYLRNSTYSPKIREAFEIYGRDNVLVMFQEEYKADPRSQLSRVEAFLGQRLFDGVELDLRAYNKAAVSRYPALSRMIYRFLKSRNPIKRVLRAMIPHEHAVKIRHAVLNFNRVEKPYQPISEATAKAIREKLAWDREQLVGLVGYCPWASISSAYEADNCSGLEYEHRQ